MYVCAFCGIKFLIICICNPGLFTANLLLIDTNAVYNIIIHGSISFEGWLTQWCGYHSLFQLTDGRLIKFMVWYDMYICMYVCMYVGKVILPLFRY